MRNYYLQQYDLVIAEARLNTLRNRLKRIEEKITNCTSQIREITVSESFEKDKFGKYLEQKEEILEEIREVEDEIKQIKKDLKKMEIALRKMHGIEEKIFVMFHIEGLKQKQIAKKIPCDISTVYKYLKQINRKILTRQKNQKIS